MKDAGRQPFVLASASPRRRALLEDAGLIFDVDAPDVDERRRDGEIATNYAERVARDKALVVAHRHPSRLVLAADTIVVVDEDVFGKPRDASDAIRMLRALSGRAHDVVTAVAAGDAAGINVRVDRTTVRMRGLTDEEIEAYVATGEPLDKAGAYAIQGGAAAFVESIDGHLDTVIGLPMSAVHALFDVYRRRDAQQPVTR
jgi:septum formation protein